MNMSSKHRACKTNEDFEKGLREFLLKKFPKSAPAQEHFFKLLQSYNSSGFAEKKLPTEIFASCNPADEKKFWQFLWEAMIYRHISNLTLSDPDYTFEAPRFSKTDKLGPDFYFSYKKKKISIEAIAPSPGENFPSEWLDTAMGQARSMPHEAMLLRWTSALRDKKTKLDILISEGNFSNDVPYVIAINSCQLSCWPSEDIGISQFPWTVEAVYPVGPLVISNGTIEQSIRESIKKSNNKDVHTNSFLTPEYEMVSAIIGCARNNMLGKMQYIEDGCSFDEQQYLNDEYFFVVVHNPMAKNPCPPKFFGNFAEYTMKEDNNSWIITRI